MAEQQIPNRGIETQMMGISTINVVDLQSDNATSPMQTEAKYGTIGEMFAGFFERARSEDTFYPKQANSEG